MKKLSPMAQCQDLPLPNNISLMNTRANQATSRMEVADNRIYGPLERKEDIFYHLVEQRQKTFCLPKETAHAWMAEQSQFKPRQSTEVRKPCFIPVEAEEKPFLRKPLAFLLQLINREKRNRWWRAANIFRGMRQTAPPFAG